MRVLMVIGVVMTLTVAPTRARALPCPSNLRFDGTTTTADVGWTGLGHDLNTGLLELGFGVSGCAGVTLGSCGQCDVAGPIPLDGGRNRRCSGNPAMQCIADVDCGAAQPCRFFASPPGPTVVGGFPLCVLNEITGPLSGTVNLSDGSFSTTLSLRTTFWSAQAPSSHFPCPTCTGGVCDGGARHGLSCQVDAHNPDFGDTSFDCPPTTSTGPSYFAALHATTLLTSGTQMRTLDANSLNCVGSPGAKCFCGSCNDDAATGCTSDADCVAIGATTCQSIFGDPASPNPCVDDSTTPEDGSLCQDVGANRGACVNDGPLAVTCSPPDPPRQCLGPYFVDDYCPLSGICSYLTPRSCFLDNGVIGGSVSVIGSASPFVDGQAPATLGALSCAGASAGSTYANAVFGFPGPVRLRAEGMLQVEPALCPPTPAACRAPAVASKSRLQIKHTDDPDQNAITWLWRKGAATTESELGDPLNGEYYELCIYDQGALVARTAADGGGTCGGKPCWQKKPHKLLFKNNDPSTRSASLVQLHDGVDGKASITFKARGARLEPPALATLDGPIDVRLHRSGSSVCWGATYAAPFDRLDADRGVFADRD
jgi:hypothetical protein